jgi:membrane-bound lytic murein transglycosylase D
MLKVPTFVALCGLLSINYLSADARPSGRGPSLEAGIVPGASRAEMSCLAVYTLQSPRRPLRKFVDAYIKENYEELAEIRERSSHPFTIIDSVMDHYALPEELRYLAVIESELRAGAVSRVGAKGPWQLMAETARELGLKVGRRSDERTNYYKSTGAAALYLRDLHREFKDWLLVLAAYNAGPGPVYRAMKLAGSRNFWALETYLSKETRQHVRRFIATAYYFTVSGPVVDPVGPVVDPVGPVVDPAGPVVDPAAPVGNPIRPLENPIGSVWDRALTFGNPAGPIGKPVRIGRDVQDHAGVIDNYFLININRNLTALQPCFALKPQLPAAAGFRTLRGLTFLT